MSLVTLLLVSLFTVAILMLPSSGADAHTCTGSQENCGKCLKGNHLHEYNGGPIYCSSSEGDYSDAAVAGAGADSGAGSPLGDLAARPLTWGLLGLLVVLLVASSAAYRGRAASLGAEL